MDELEYWRRQATTWKLRSELWKKRYQDLKDEADIKNMPKKRKPKKRKPKPRREVISSISGICGPSFNPGDQWTAKPKQGTITTDERGEVKARARYACEICGVKLKKYQGNVHHIDRDIYNNAMTNLLYLCVPCHLDQHPEKQGLPRTG